MKKIIFLLLFSWLTYGQQPIITAAEYFWGSNDPGNGNGNGLTVEDGIFNERIESVIATYANTQATAGSVLFNIRVKDGTGKWGPLFKKAIYINDNTFVSRQIKLTKFEYFFGNFDPGEGNGTTIIAFDGVLDEAVETAFRSQATWDIASGPVLFNIRAKDVDNKWGPLFKKVVFPYGANTSPNLILEGNSIAVCPGSSVTLNYAGPNGYTPTWFDGSHGQSITFIPSNEGNYSVTASFENSTYTDDIAITFKALPSATITPSGQILVCSSSNFNLVANSGTGLSYQWYLNTNLITTATNRNYLPTALGNFTVKVTDSSTSCSKISEPTVLVNAFAITPSGTVSATTNQSLSVPLGSSNTYQWKKDGVTISGATSNTYNATNSGNYTCVVTSGSCNYTTSATIVSLTNGTSTSAPTGNTNQTFCSGATITNLVATGTLIKWYSASTGGTALANTVVLVNGATYYASQTLNGTESTSRLAVIVSITNTTAPTGNTTQTFCSSSTIANLTASGTAIKWYAAATGGTDLTSTTALVNGTTYYASQTVNSCESASRLAVTVIIPNTTAPTGNTTQTFCPSATIANLTASGTAIKWYAASTGGTALASTTALVNGTTYYASQTVNSCESASRFALTVSITNTAAPTGNTTQPFCSSATIANLTASGTAIKWYSAATGGSALASTTALVNGTTYYASQTVNSCESANRLAVTVSITNTAAPTGNTTQPFCSSATIANLTASGTAIKWYSAATGGSALASTTAIVNGITYYASQTVNSCESASRLAVTVSVTNAAAPTGNTTQTFCSSGTIANLTVTGTAIKWYAAATGGSALAGTTALVNGTTYYATQTINSCESSDRLAVNVSVTNTVAPTGNAIQTFITGSTLSDILVTGTAIKWYTSATGGNPLTNTTPLVNGGIYYGSQTVNGCESQSRFMVTVTVTPFTLPYNNFAIETKSETCASKNNGQIIINATQTYNYTATINGTNYTFVNNSLTVSNLAPGVYTICIGVTGKTFEQCYSVTIGKGGSITGKSSISSNKAIVDITSGTAPFEILINGTPQFETSETNFAVSVKQGDLLEVKTAIACEGIYAKTILDGLVGVQIYPNPTAGLFEITIPTSKTEVEVEIYSTGSQLISKWKYPVINQRIQLSLEKESDGVYFARVKLDVPVSLTIIKKS